MKTNLLTILIIIAFSITLLAIAVWAATGFHAYTKYEVVEIQETEVKSDDIFADTGLYDDATKKEVIQKDEFHLGLIPTPEGLFDKHMISVASVVGPVWVLTGIVFWLDRRKRKSQK